jgi:hypothetical protein
MSNILKHFSIILLLGLFSCQSEEPETEVLQDESVQEETVVQDQALVEEQQNTIEAQRMQIAQLEQRLGALERQSSMVTNTSTKETEQSTPFNGTQYFFMVLEVVEDHIYEKRKMYYTSRVNEISNYDDNIKYRLLDEFVSVYKNSADGMVYKGNVKKRNVHLYNSYEEASRAREKYIMN